MEDSTCRRSCCQGLSVLSLSHPLRPEKAFAVTFRSLPQSCRSQLYQDVRQGFLQSAKSQICSIDHPEVWMKVVTTLTHCMMPADRKITISSYVEPKAPALCRHCA